MKRQPPLVVECSILLAWGFLLAPTGQTQPQRNIKVVLESRQSGALDQESLQGAGGVIVRRGTANPSGRIVGGERQTTVQRSSGILTLVVDGGESILTVATRVPRSEIAYYYNYALGARYVERRIVFEDVGTSLRVRAHILPDGQISLRLTPRISYFSSEHPGAIDFTEAATELIVPNGQPVSLGGSTRHLHEITRRILGYQNRTATAETGLAVTATIQN